MVKKRYEHRDPIIRDVHSVVQGNLYVGRKALTGGGLFVSEKFYENSFYYFIYTRLSNFSSFIPAKMEI